MGPARRVAKDFGSISSCCRLSEATKAPVEGEQHALDIEIDLVARSKAISFAYLAIKPTIVVEFVEIGEAILAADRQVVGELPLDAAAEGHAVGIKAVAIVENSFTVEVSEPEFGVYIDPAPTNQTED